jgi:hypothetical protein
MAWFADLEPCTYYGAANARFLRAVGWLQRGKPFATGPVDPAVLERLIDFAKDPVDPVFFFGVHFCDLCPPGCGAFSHRNVFIPFEDMLLVCPQGIVHYIEAHAYQPPTVFCEAVLSCPPRQSEQYMESVGKRVRPDGHIGELVPDQPASAGGWVG